MKNIYNKGRFRFYEYGKSLGPYMKRKGNKRWRRTAIQGLESSGVEQMENGRSLAPVKRKRRKPIVVRLTIQHRGACGPFSMHYTRKYKTMRDVQNALNNPTVLKAEFIKGGPVT